MKMSFTITESEKIKFYKFDSIKLWNTPDKDNIFISVYLMYMILWNIWAIQSLIPPIFLTICFTT